MSEMSSDRNPVEALAEEFVARYRRGERPPLTEYTDKHPELAEEIRDLFPALLMMEDIRPNSHEVTGAFGPTDSLVEGKKLERVGDYRILREVGRGGMGIVYEAEQESLGRHVALKVLPAHSLLDPQRLRRFQREAKAAARLHHTNIVPVFGVGEDDGLHYYVMQFIQGQGLDEVLVELKKLRQAKSESPRNIPGSQLSTLPCERASEIAHGLLTGQFELGPVPPSPPGGEGTGVRDTGFVLHSPPHPNPLPPGERESQLSLSDSGIHLPGQPAHSTLTDSGRQYCQSIARIGIQVAEALTYAHSQGTLHRDIKPSNLLLDTQGTVWITDFGLAKAVESDDLTRTGDIVGTIRYMAPERFEGKSDARSDVYGLGVTLYELLTLRPAFEESDRLRLVQRVTQEDPPAPRRFDRRIPRDLETVVLKAIAKEPEKRYQSATELATDLKRFAEDKPIRARRVGAAERLWRWSRRNPALAWLTGSVAALLLAVAVVSTLSAVWLKGERDRVAEAERKARLREAEALVGKAHGIRLSQRPGQRFAALEALSKAAAIGRELDQPATWFDQLRNEAIAALALPDIHITQEWDWTHQWQEDWPVTTGIGMSDDFELYVRFDPYGLADEKGQCTIHRLADHAGIARLPAFGEPVAVSFGAGRTLVVRGKSSGRFQLWALDENKPVLRFPESQVKEAEFRQDGRLIALSHTDGAISVYDTATGQRQWRLLPLDNVQGFLAHLHPRLPLVAIVSYGFREVPIRDLTSGAVVATALPPWPKGNGDAAWSPDGRVLTVSQGDGGKIQRFTFDPATTTLRPMPAIQGPVSGAPRISYNPAGDRFVCCGWNNKVALYEVDSGQLLFTSHAHGGAELRFNSTGERLGGVRTGDRKEKIGLWSVADGREYQALIDEQKGDTNGEQSPRPAIHPGNRLAAYGGPEAVVLFDLETGRKLARVPSGQPPRPYTAVAFDGAGNLLTNGFAGAFRWPVHPLAGEPAEAPGEPEHLRIGSAERLPFHPGNREIAASADGQVIAQAMYNGYGMQHPGGWFLRPKSPRPQQVDGQCAVTCASVSPDGRWVAFGTNQGGIRVHDASSGELVLRSPFKHGDYCRFSADGRWLVTDVDGGQVYAVGTWAPGPKLGPGTAWNATKDVAVMEQPNGIYRLVELATGRELARLEDPEQNSGAAVFTPDGSKLVVSAKNGLRVWDLQRIRAELRRLDLDWYGPPFFESRIEEDEPSSPMTGSQKKPELQVEIDPGDLTAREKYSLILTFFPFHAEAYYQRGQAYSRFEEWDKARSDFTMCLALKPDHIDAYYRRGLTYARQSRHPEALADFSRTIDLQPTNGKVYLARGQAHLNLQQWQNAVADLSKSLELSPDNHKARHLRATAYTRLEKWAEALADLNRAIELNGSCEQAWSDRGLVHVQEGQWQEAANDFAKGTELNPQEHWYWYQSTALALQLGDVEGYRRICREMLKRFGDSDRPEVAERTAKACLLIADAVTDQETISKLVDGALSDDGSNHWRLLHKAMAEYRAGRYAEAVARLERMAPQANGGHCDAQGFAVLAMAKYKLAVAQEARAALENAQAILAEHLPDPKAGRPFGGDFHDWLHAQILCREAEALLSSKKEKNSPQRHKGHKERRGLRNDNRESKAMTSFLDSRSSVFSVLCAFVVSEKSAGGFGAPV